MLPAVMPMHDGERVKISGSTGSVYELSREGSTYACTCPAWTKQKQPPSQRTCKHLRSHLGDAHEDARLSGNPAADARVTAAQERARKAIIKGTHEPPELRAHRKAGLAAALARFPAAAARMRATYDMPLPRHLAYAVGFWLGLTAEERSEAWSYFGCGPAGISEWFEDGGLDRIAMLDERLHYRYRSDPPEFVTVWSGNSDGGHWGLWYDDPHQLPRLLVHNYARDSAENYPGKPTLLDSLRDEQKRYQFNIKEYTHAPRIMVWFEEVLAQELAAHRDEKIGPPPLRTNHSVGGLDPVIPGHTLPDDLSIFRANDDRIETYKRDHATTRRWISQAKAELAQHKPLRALFLARELHWLDSDDHREAAADLGIRAYQEAGRHQLAEVLRVHVANRDLGNVGIYRDPPLPPLVDAALRGDLAALELLLLDNPDPTTISRALTHATSPAILDRLLTASPIDAPPIKLADAVRKIAAARVYDHHDEANTAVVDHLLARDVSPDLAFAEALRGNTPELALRLAAQVDTHKLDSEGLYPLHRATQAGDVAVVRALLARGADPLARDAHGKTPHERARSIWQDKRAEALELLGLLPESAVKIALADYAVGDTITHAKFGPGQIVARSGSGDAAKLTIDFADAQRQLLAKFIRRA